MGEQGAKVYTARHGRDKPRVIVVLSTKVVRSTARQVVVESSEASGYRMTLRREDVDWTEAGAVRRLLAEDGRTLTRAHSDYVLALERYKAAKAWLVEASAMLGEIGAEPVVLTVSECPPDADVTP